MDLQSDEILLGRIKNNDQAALDALHNKYYDSLSVFAYGYIKSFDIVQEIISDVFLKVWLLRVKIDSQINCKTYLYTSVKNQSLNYLKKKSLPLYEDVFHINKEASEVYNSDATFNLEETQNIIDEILNGLPTQRRRIFELNRIDGLKYKEIAEILSITVDTVQKQMTEAVKYISKFSPLFKSIFIGLFLLFKHTTY